MVEGGLNSLPTPERTAAALLDTVQRIRAVDPAAKIALVGPAPIWNGTLKDAILAWTRDHGGRLPPLYSDFRLAPETFDWDRYLRQAAARAGLGYFSTTDALCRIGQCLTRFSDDAGRLTAIDNGHLTPAASRFVIDHYGNQILGDLK